MTREGVIESSFGRINTSKEMTTVEEEEEGQVVRELSTERENEMLSEGDIEPSFGRIDMSGTLSTIENGEKEVQVAPWDEREQNDSSLARKKFRRRRSRSRNLKRNNNSPVALISRKSLLIGPLLIIATIVFGALYFTNREKSDLTPNEGNQKDPPIATPSPTNKPTTSYPTIQPTISDLTKVPSLSPVVAPVTPTLTYAPTKTPTQDPTTTPTKIPTQDPTIRPTMSTIAPTPSQPTINTSNETLALTNYLNEEYGVYVKPNTSASLAVEWLALEAILDNRDLVLTSKLAQRFALLTMDYALSATTAEPTSLSVGTVNEDECSWNGVTCEDSKVIGIKFGAMNLQGSLPTEIGMLSSLVHLDVSNNRVIGTIPEELYDLARLEKIFLYENNLSGTISSRIINLWDLSHYHLGQNKLTGTIPTTMRSNSRGIYKIRYFNVYNNEMTGTLEEGMRLRQMWYMDLGRNKFSGTLPSLAEFVRLRHLHLDFNNFTGTVPSTVVTAGDGRIQTLTLNNNALTGDLPGDFQFYNHLGKRLSLFFAKKCL